MISRRCFVVTGLAIAFATGMSGSSNAQELPKLKEKKTYKVGFSQTESNNPWRLAETESVKSEAAKNAVTSSSTPMQPARLPNRWLM